mgnify:CR=1 FL=1
MGYSKTHFMAVFKQHAGTSCTEFIIQVRLNKACDLLMNTSDPILEIATAVGFNNLSNFNRQFKRYYELTPSQYRKQLKKAHLYWTSSIKRVCSVNPQIKWTVKKVSFLEGTLT